MTPMYLFSTKISQIYLSWPIAFSSNKMKINIDKTNYMLLNPSAQNLKLIDSLNLKLLIGNAHIARTNCVKYLGIFMDEKLKWKEHIEYLQKKIIKFNLLEFFIKK